MVGRVSPYARSVGQGTIVKAIGGKKWTRQLNDDDIRKRNALDIEKLDLGPAFGRRLQFRTRAAGASVRPEFETERELLRGNQTRGRVYVRTGKFQGGALTFSIANGGAGYQLDNLTLPADIQAELDKVQGEIKSGALTPPADIP
jgi:hypothetical protein